ncbi:hypothetical protein ACGFIW_30805 [Micromonospora sp. NPDC048935]
MRCGGISSATGRQPAGQRGDRVTRCLEIAEKNGANPGLCINPGIVTGK